MNAINKSSSEPYYLQLAHILEEQIKSGEYKPDDSIPGEIELCRLYDLSRSTVRQALQTLEKQQLIKMVPRRGAFVTSAKDNQWNLQVIQGFLETEARSSSQKIETKVLYADFDKLPSFAAHALNLNVGEQGFVIKRVRYIDGKVAIYSTNYLPASVGKKLVGKPVLEGKASLNVTLREVGLYIHSARREVAAVAAPTDILEVLGLSQGAPILLIKSISCDKDGPFDFYQSYVRSDVVTISVSAEAS